MDYKRRPGAETGASTGSGPRKTQSKGTDSSDVEWSCDAGCASKTLQPAVRVEDIVEVYRPLAKPWKTWIQSDIDSAVPVLSNRLNFIAGGCSSESVSLCKFE